MEFGLDTDDPLAALARLEGLRGALDQAERDLIAAARQRGASWGQVSEALGLRSRQAAEQRWLRLSNPTSRDPVVTRSTRSRQRSVDGKAGTAISALRSTVLAAVRRLDSEPDWDRVDARAALVRASLTLAAAADPGGLFSLTEKAIADLDAFAVRVESPTAGVALDRVRRCLEAARPH
jgi:lambda repressor-like predicted transcriptional regulator